MRISKFLKIFLVFILAYSLQLTILNSLFAQDKIVAIVNGDIITQKDLNDFLNFMRVQLATELKGKELETKIQSMKLDLLDKLIEDRLILQEAKKAKVIIDEDRVKAKIREIRERYPSDREFQKLLAQQGLVQADLEAKIREQLLMYNIVEIEIRSKIVINPGEVTDFYQNNTQEFRLPEQREFEAIKIEDENIVKGISDSLKKDEPLEDLIKKYSLEVNRLNAIEGQLRSDIANIVFKLKPDELTQPQKLQDGYYIFKLNRIIPPQQQGLCDVQDKIYNFLFDRKMQEELTRWVDELKEHSYIKIF